ncbi:MAG: HTTM domain-containing protein [Planctomycetaceae bacterium]
MSEPPEPVSSQRWHNPFGRAMTSPNSVNANHGPAPESPLSSCCRQLFVPVDVLPLACFRIFFGAIMLYDVAASLSWGSVAALYIEPPFHFTYPGFGWVKPWPGQGMIIHYWVLVFAAAGIMLGCCYRFSATMFALGMTYVFLLEKSLYQNHYYLVCLISGIMVFVPAHRMWSVDALVRRKGRVHTAPQIWLWLLRVQLAIPYIYGGMAKINDDWLHGMPMRIWLEQRTYLPVIGPWMTSDFVVYLICWGGLVFDLLVVPALFWRPTRTIAYAAALGFHLTNVFLWDIGIFPWFMIGATLLFFPAGSFRQALFRRGTRRSGPSDSSVAWTWRNRTTVAATGVFVTWQLLFPFRHFLYPGNVHWTNEAHHFSWHMMLRDKVAETRFVISNTHTGKRGLVRVEDILSQTQYVIMGEDADMIVEFAQFVAAGYRERDEGNVEIRVLAVASLNGRKYQLFMNPQIDYASVDRPWGTQPWIIPLHEPLRTDGWNLSAEQRTAEIGVLIPAEMRLP